MGKKSGSSTIVDQTGVSFLTGPTGVQCCISVDIDAVAGWLGSYGGEDSTSDISRGLFAGTIGVRRMLKLFEKYNIKTTWFIPGHSLETFPEECRMIVDAGHEIGLHGYSHENPKAMTLEQQTAIMDKVMAIVGPLKAELIVADISLVLQAHPRLSAWQAASWDSGAMVGSFQRRRRTPAQVRCGVRPLFLPP